MSAAGIAAARIADKVALAHLGRPPRDPDDPANEAWWKLRGRIERSAEDEIGRAKLLQVGRLQDVIDCWKRVQSCGPLHSITIAQSAAFAALETAMRKAGA